MIKKKVNITVVCAIAALLFVVIASKPGIITKEPTPYVEANGRVYYREEPAPLKSPVKDEDIKPTDAKKFTGNIDEVKIYLADALKNAKSIPDSIKTQCADLAIGQPLFVEDRRPVKNRHNYYLIPLTRYSKINAFCSVTVYGDEIAFASFASFSDTKDSVFTRDIEMINKKLKAEKGMEIKNYKLVYNPDKANRTNLNILEPFYEIETSTGKIIYYSGSDRFLEKSEFDNFGKVRSNEKSG